MAGDYFLSGFCIESPQNLIYDNNKITNNMEINLNFPTHLEHSHILEAKVGSVIVRLTKRLDYAKNSNEIPEEEINFVSGIINSYNEILSKTKELEKEYEKYAVKFIKNLGVIEYLTSSDHPNHEELNKCIKSSTEIGDKLQEILSEVNQVSSKSIPEVMEEILKFVQQ